MDKTGLDLLQLLVVLSSFFLTPAYGYNRPTALPLGDVTIGRNIHEPPLDHCVQLCTQSAAGATCWPSPYLTGPRERTSGLLLLLSSLLLK